MSNKLTNEAATTKSLNTRQYQEVRMRPLIPTVVIVTISCVAKFITADVYDHLMPTWKPDPNTCEDKCVEWNKIPNINDQREMNSKWRYNKPPSDAGSSCAMPGGSAGKFECDGCSIDDVTNSYAGPWCYCNTPKKGQNHTQYCIAPTNVPEQINLQIADSTSVVVSFVTREEHAPTSKEPPIAHFGETETDLKKIKGVTHHYKKLSEVEKISYSLHFIKFAGLQPGKQYYYKVQSPTSSISKLFSFRGVNPKEPKFAIYGDMGHSKYNPMENLKNACEAGKIDFLVHMGDHAYDLGGATDKRGDAYMNVYQPALSSCPWIPIIGNHEANDGDNFNRYLNMTFGETLGRDDTIIKSTATSVLGDFLTKATLFGLGFHSPIPSKTSRYFALTLGLVHIIGLDLNNLDSDQLKWLDKDLASVNREETPWILASSHFPMYHPLMQGNLNASSNFFLGEGHEKFTTSGHDFVPLQCASNDNKVCNDQTVGEWLKAQQNKLLPLLRKYGVDLYDAGHVHDYAVTWPICNNGTICKNMQGKNLTSYKNPLGTVHVTEGNGGVPGVAGKNTIIGCNSTSPSWCRKRGTGGAFGIIKIFNNTHLQYSHHENPTNKVTDEFVIEQHNHGPFSL